MTFEEKGVTGLIGTVLVGLITAFFHGGDHATTEASPTRECVPVIVESQQQTQQTPHEEIIILISPCVAEQH
jgi:phosphopentomutase